MLTKARATVEDLYRVPENGKAEIINGELILMSPTGSSPGRAATKIVISLGKYEEEHRGGYAYADNTGFLVDLPDRSSFSPDAAWYTGSPNEVNTMKFVKGAPALAVEVRSENDYGPAAERAIVKKIADYFAAGTQVVWDVDLLSTDVVTVYRSADPQHPVKSQRGETAEAEPAVPGWTFPVDKLFG
jgi:Uma2 family endonuclease